MKRMALFALVAGVVAAGALPAVARAAAPTTVHLRGTIAAVTASSLTITTATGPMTVRLVPKTGFAGATAGSMADIKPGTFLGIASAPAAGANRALEVTVFPDAMRGTGEGDYPWDSPTPMHHSTMTNGTVSLPASHSTMTNATVGAMSGDAQKTITMNYKGGSRTLIVPANAPVVRIAPGTKALLQPGRAVFAIATKTAASNALFVVVGAAGVKPPM
jgi:hypothetical protein